MCISKAFKQIQAFSKKKKLILNKMLVNIMFFSFPITYPHEKSLGDYDRRMKPRPYCDYLVIPLSIQRNKTEPNSVVF